MHEFELIQRYFTRAQGHSEGLLLGVGDDCALLQLPADEVLAVSVDTLVAGVHFPVDAAPEDIAQRALRVNLSDLAAVGARPLWFTLALTLPEVNANWLDGFSLGLFAAAEEYGCALAGGDTTAGSLSITLQVMGAVSQKRALRRSGAGVGDRVFVTGSLGDGAAGLAVIQGDLSLSPEHSDYLQRRYYRPEPRLKEGQLLAGLASAAIDISDGLLADLGHICAASAVAADVELESLPLSPALQAMDDAEQEQRWALTGGDDYQLCFTVPQARLSQLNKLITGGLLQASAIGEIRQGTGVHCHLAGRPVDVESQGYNHFL